MRLLSTLILILACSLLYAQKKNWKEEVIWYCAKLSRPLDAGDKAQIDHVVDTMSLETHKELRKLKVRIVYIPKSQATEDPTDAKLAIRNVVTYLNSIGITKIKVVLLPYHHEITTGDCEDIELGIEIAS